MNFWSTVLAVIVGFSIWYIFDAVVRAVVKALIEWLPEKRRERKIGFEEVGDRGKTVKGPTMRKIGFGAND